MEGSQLDKDFAGLDTARQQDFICQIADVFKLVQSYQLPASVKGFGRLGFDHSGNIVTGPTTIPCGGPFNEFHEMYTQMLRRQLLETDSSERIGGWRRNGIRDRLDRFAVEGIAQQVKTNSIPRPTLVHGDFSETFKRIFLRANRERNITLPMFGQTDLCLTRYLQHAIRPANEPTDRDPRLRICPHRLPRRRILLFLPHH